MLKCPEINAKGDVTYRTLRCELHFLENTEFETKELKKRLDSIDDFSEIFGNGTKTNVYYFHEPVLIFRVEDLLEIHIIFIDRIYIIVKHTDDN